ncbi:MAG: formate--tetrahydrofolate ligase [Chitinivibrionales bacterium]|nr:formate--tetrahydrofolate ligase [Chitinivibrionales bacterium]MBD3358282.1 formate--tetrahydrofolate ligase [Chitinivibrionales bacterium]
MTMKSDIAIARSAAKRPIEEIAAGVGLRFEDLIPYGRHIAKVPVELASKPRKEGPGKLILVTAMTPTPQGEGKTTNTIGLGQAMKKIGKNVMIAIREPSLGPCMGLKGGAAGGGYSQVLPMEDINLHFTGDLHAISATHNLLAAVIDNHLHQRAEPAIHPRKVCWRRVIDMNDRTLRNIIVGLGGAGINGVMREDGFEITAASEVMAILCLARSIADLKERLSNIVVGYDYLGKSVTVADIGVQGAMTALLKHAINPNLVQSIEGVPVLVHGGPFANIAHGCNTLVATRAALNLGDYVITEAGFGADLGAEKFFDIKCRVGDLTPSAVVLVVTRRAVAAHGIENVMKHVENVRLFGLPVIVSINRFLGDNDTDLQNILKQCREGGVDASITDFREAGGEGGLELAEKVCSHCDSPGSFAPLYPLDMKIEEKISTIAQKVYGAANVELSDKARKAIKRIEDLGYGNLPVCMAKTPASLSDDPRSPGRPTGFTITVSDAKVSAGAGFVVVYTGTIMTMPGLPKHPAALDIDINNEGEISGLF